jgi:5-methylcytosine-specific restriction endonuclease McrA
MDAYNYVPDVNRFVDPFGLMPKFTPATKGKIVKENQTFFGTPRCEKCGCKVIKPKKSISGVTPSQKEWQIDHIKADSKGGAAVEKNGQVLCRKCNRAKSDKYTKNFKSTNRKKTKAQLKKFCK